ncbi:helix-turn-helix domain-containing protein [Hyphococcus sp.]|jgi:putative transcriptional regulator|uniref:helix-turn-helix domain-containing protein n=1 Tax=Hyphococcus sp. TaxID=2038636 RepID=UPI003D0AD4D8
MSRKPLSERVLSAAREARDHAAGKIKLAEHLPVIPENVDVAQIRARSNLSQAKFAQRIGVSAATLKNWEQGHRKPSGPSLVLLAMLSKNPRIVEETLAPEQA